MARGAGAEGRRGAAGGVVAIAPNYWRGIGSDQRPARGQRPFSQAPEPG